MGIRTVRLDQETEREAQRVPYDIYKELDLGPGGYAIAPATQTRRGVRAAIRPKRRTLPTGVVEKFSRPSGNRSSRLVLS